MGLGVRERTLATWGVVQLVADVAAVGVDEREQTRRRNIGSGCRFCPTRPDALRWRCCCLSKHQKAFYSELRKC